MIPFVPEGVEKRAILILCIFLSFLGNLCVGPSQFFGFPDEMWVMIVGQALHGILDPCILVPALPEMIECSLPLFPGQETEVNDLSSGIYNTFLGIGQVLAPIFGSLVVNAFEDKAKGFKVCIDLVSLICLVYAIAYYVICDGWNAFGESRWRNLDPTEPQILF